MTKKLPPFWRRDEPAAEFDVCRLRPASLPRDQRFETSADSVRQSRNDQATLEVGGHKDREIANRFSACREDGIRCGTPGCHVCGREVRRWHAGQALAFTSGSKATVRILTISMGRARRGELEELDLHKITHRLSVRLDRHFPGASIFGGIEIALKRKRWVLHAHLAVFGSTKEQRVAFRQACKVDGKRAVKSQKLRDEVDQLTYLVKFQTYHRPRQRSGASKAQAVPLAKWDLCEVARWRARYGFEDFLFRKGLTRTGPFVRAGGG